MVDPAQLCPRGDLGVGTVVDVFACAAIADSSEDVAEVGDGEKLYGTVSIGSSIG